MLVSVIVAPDTTAPVVSLIVRSQFPACLGVNHKRATKQRDGYDDKCFLHCALLSFMRASVCVADETCLRKLSSFVKTHVTQQNQVFKKMK
jgi:hypothetical protein